MPARISSLVRVASVAAIPLILVLAAQPAAAAQQTPKPAPAIHASAARVVPHVTPANAVVPNSAISGFTPVDFPPNDDGTFPCGGDGNAPPPCTPPDTGPATVPLGFNINFFGTEYSGAYVNNNGNITFDSPLSEFTPEGLEGTSHVIIAPFFADVDTRVGNTVNFGTGTLNGDKVFVVNWPSVGCFAENDAVTDDFQVILFDRPDLGTGALGDDFNIEFNYDSIQWDAGQASGGDANCTNASDSSSAAVGFSNGTTTPGDSFQLAGSQTSGAFLDTNTSTGLIFNDLNSTVLGRYLFTVFGGAPITTPEQPTSITTSLSGAGQTGATITVPPGTAVTDSATLTGANVATALGSVTYAVYSDSACTTAVGAPASETITTAGSIPASAPVTLSAAGTYYWQASYSGDSTNEASTSTCGSEVETVSSTAITAASTADATPVTPGASDGYTDTITNGTAAAVTLSSVTDTLPAGFSYVAGSTTGGITVDPSVAGAQLTWTGPFTVPANGALTFHFRVTVATTPGQYTNSVTASAGAATVTPATNVAPIDVAFIVTTPAFPLEGLPIAAVIAGGSLALWLRRRRRHARRDAAPATA